MTRTCGKCSRVNPAGAAYCYFDGTALDGGHRGVNGAAVTGIFPHPFVFPSGLACRSFDELSMACQKHWAEAAALLEQGHLETFLAGLGRRDLAEAAREAARFPDRDRGLDELLAKFPSRVISGPKLDLAPREVSLGLLSIGADRRFELRLRNQGMRLLYGSIQCDDCIWLAVGEGRGVPRKLFQFDEELAIVVQVLGQQLHASSRPLEGRLLVESNGGNAVVIVRVEVQVKPYPDGALAGASSPRQLAEKAKASPRAAAADFEKGKVARWYRDNGWTYPVQGPAASGLGAVQQFFEALGLTPPPKVEVNPAVITLRGNPGEQMRSAIEVRTAEKRPVYAHARSDQPWLEVGRAQLNGRTATVPLAIPSVPDRAGETLHAQVTIRANGNQRFVVPVTLEVGEGLRFGGSGPLPVAVPIPSQQPAPPRGVLVHALPAALLILTLFLIALADVRTQPPAAAVPTTTNEADFRVGLDDPEPRIGIKLNEEGSRFGIVMLRAKDPENPDRLKRLTYDERGASNNTCIKLDGMEGLFGGAPGRACRETGPAPALTEPEGGQRWRSCWEYPNERVRVHQRVDLVPGEQTRVLDTCLVRYEVENLDNTVHTVGVRVMLDTFIGANDGVPFLVPGSSSLIQTKRHFSYKEIPSFIRAHERADLRDPGTVALLGLKLHSAEEIESVLICRWPGNPDVRWEWQPKAMNDPPDEKPDSCIALYWAYRKMFPGEKREMAFTYGLGTVSGASGSIGVATHGATRPGGIFTVTAYVKQPSPGQRVTLQLPAELVLEPEETPEKTIPAVEPGKDGQVSWRVHASQVGDWKLSVSSGSVRQEHTVRINERSIFD